MPYLNLIPWTISAISLLFCILTFARNGRKDTVKAIEEEDKKFDGIKESLLKANMKLDQVCSTTTETRSDIKSLNKDIIMIDRRLTIVERDMKTAFNSIDELKGVAKHD